MGGALLAGWLREGLDPTSVHVQDPTPAAEAERKGEAKPEEEGRAKSSSPRPPTGSSRRLRSRS